MQSPSHCVPEEQHKQSSSIRTSPFSTSNHLKSSAEERERKRTQNRNQYMAGLGVILESKEKFSGYSHIISKTSLRKNNSLSSAATSTSSYESTFLEYCYLCRRELQQGKDIYMYRGDRAFCSEECRCRQIFMDEESVMRDHCSMAAAATATKGKYPLGRRRGKAATKEEAFAGGFAY